MNIAAVSSNGVATDFSDDPIASEIETVAAKANAAANPWASKFRVAPPDWYTASPPPRRWLLRDARTENRDGVFPLGKVGLLAAAGGSGKTSAAAQLAVAVATGTSWLDAFDVPNPGKVLLVLGEEDDEECHRRLYRAARQIGSEAWPTNITVAPLAGVTCPLVHGLEDAPFLGWLRDYVAGTGPYALIILDPISRFASAEMETDNAAATRYVVALESLIAPSGGASILGCHHTNQTSRGEGATVDITSVRGVSGITDAARWVSVMGVARFACDGRIDSAVTLAMAKSNYSMFAAPIMLRYGEGGALVPMSDEERTSFDRARNDADPQAKRQRRREQTATDARVKEDDIAIGIVGEQPGIVLRDLLRLVKARAHVADKKADTIITRVIDQGRVRRSQEGNSFRHYVTDDATSPNSNGAHHQDAQIQLHERLG